MNQTRVARQRASSSASSSLARGMARECVARQPMCQCVLRIDAGIARAYLARMPRRKPNLVPPSPAPPTWRDPWAWASALAVVPLVVKCIGGALGEPAAEDFDMLHRVLFERSHSLLDGGGTSAFWRPVSFQLYFGAFGRMLLARPAGVAFVHAVLLALTAVIL